MSFELLYVVVCTNNFYTNWLVFSFSNFLKSGSILVIETAV